MRIIGDRTRDDREAYIPLAPGTRLVFAHFLNPPPPTPEEQAKAKADREREQAARAATLDALVKRHAALFEQAVHPAVRALLRDHGPHLVNGLDGRGSAECRGCPSYTDESEYGEGDEVHHDWPCPTWATIDESTTDG